LYKVEKFAAQLHRGAEGIGGGLGGGRDSWLFVGELCIYVLHINKLKEIYEHLFSYT
jgi:hypothetical protein